MSKIFSWKHCDCDLFHVYPEDPHLLFIDNKLSVYPWAPIQSINVIQMIGCYSNKKDINIFMLVFFLFYFYWSIVNIQYYISFRCITSWFKIFIYYKLITIISLVIIHLHAMLLQYYWLYSLCCTLHAYDLFIL